MESWQDDDDDSLSARVRRTRPEWGHGYRDEPLTDAMVRDVERELGYTLPRAYVALMRSQNGGRPRNTCHPMSEPTNWAPDHIAITGIFAIGSTCSYSLCGEMGSRFWMTEWGYPPIGVYFADTPSGGHHMLCLDYRACGPTGEPTVVFVSQDAGYETTLVARTVGDFLRGLSPELDDPEADIA